MGRPHLIVVCGIPGSGKSTFSLLAVERWAAISFASETFADKLGAAARTTSGDLSREAIAHAYSEMGRAVTEVLAKNKLVLAVGSFRAAEQRRQFRDIAVRVGADVTTIRIACPVNLAAERVRERIAKGEHGPTEGAIQRIDAELTRADDITIVINNDSTIDQFYRLAEAVVGGMIAL